MIVQEVFTKLTSQESSFINGSNGELLNSILAGIKEGENSTQLIESVRDTVSKLSQATGVSLFDGYFDHIKTEADTLTLDSVAKQFHVRVLPDYRYGSARDSFNVLNSSVSSGFFSLVERPLPVRILKKHVSERFNQRSKFEEVFDAENMLHTLAIATAMVKIVENNTNWHKTKEVPFAMPGEDGLFLGVVKPVKEKQHFNRFYFSAVGQDSLEAYGTLSKFKWIPKATAEVKTFIGQHELKSNQKKLLETLQKYLTPEVKHSLTESVFSYQDTAKYQENRDDNALPYKEAEDTLHRLMKSKIWRSTVNGAGATYLPNGVILRP